MSEITTDDGCRIFYRWDGPEGAPVLMLGNPIGTDHTLWDPVLPLLKGKVRTLRFDTRGHGASDSPAGDYAIERLGRDALALINALQLVRVAYCGVSLGGMIGQWLAGSVPTRIVHFIPVCTTAYYGDPTPWAQRIATVQKEGMAAILPGLPGRWFTEGFIAKAPETVAAVQAMVGRQNPDGYSGCCAAIRDMDLRPLLGHIKARTSVIVGDADPATPPAMGEAIAAAIPDARLTVLKTSHFAHVEVPDALATAILAALEA
ncbi:3-oxoadipate enol-lactonase [Lacibacterium aquatile]|uniref:3-oxoadipate enol-lactonase n=1 Tax=Lacibacterium aquatile TaxID=1168082 RepID=A0ABW5DQ43_9PROT